MFHNKTIEETEYENTNCLQKILINWTLENRQLNHFHHWYNFYLSLENIFLTESRRWFFFFLYQDFPCESPSLLFSCPWRLFLELLCGPSSAWGLTQTCRTCPTVSTSWTAGVPDVLGPPGRTASSAGSALGNSGWTTLTRRMKNQRKHIWRETDLILSDFCILL